MGAARKDQPVRQSGEEHEVIGRFAPSPTGSLHPGSLVAAVGSWLFSRSAGGRWLVRIEDLDPPRIVAGSAERILETLRRYGLEWDGAVMRQSDRTPAYAEALARLRERSLLYDCGCSRSELQRAASAPHGREPVYPGTCRGGLPDGKQARAIRFRVPPSTIVFDDLVLGRVREDLAVECGDFVVRRADGVFAYQLAVVVDDAAQNVTQVIRGADLQTSTARQIALQQALKLPTPAYGHVPMVVDDNGSKYGKGDGALHLRSLDASEIARTLSRALSVLGIRDARPGDPSAMLRDALGRFDPATIPRGPVRWSHGS